MEAITDILKWTALVLAAGFIGYFGRYLAIIIIKKIRKEPPESTITHKKADEEKYKYKLEKKKLKLEKKKAKKV